MDAIAEARHRRFRGEQMASRTLAERDDQPRCDEVDLPVEVCAAGLRLRRLGGAVVRRPALQHVRDVDVLGSRKSKGREHVVEQLSRDANERLPLGVLVSARCLADEHPLRTKIANARNRPFARPRQGTRGALSDISYECLVVECRDACISRTRVVL